MVFYYFTVGAYGCKILLTNTGNYRAGTFSVKKRAREVSCFVPFVGKYKGNLKNYKNLYIFR